MQFNEKKGLFAGHGITTRVFINDVDQQSDGIYWWLPQLEDRQFTPQIARIDRDDLPQALNFATSVIRIHSYDDETREIDVEYLRDFTYATLTIRLVYYY